MCSRGNTPLLPIDTPLPAGVASLRELKYLYTKSRGNSCIRVKTRECILMFSWLINIPTENKFKRFLMTPTTSLKTCYGLCERLSHCPNQSLNELLWIVSHEPFKHETLHSSFVTFLSAYNDTIKTGHK